jgi:hypothetical protein
MELAHNHHQTIECMHFTGILHANLHFAITIQCRLVRDNGTFKLCETLVIWCLCGIFFCHQGTKTLSYH